jgi:hypothetical protein
MVPVVTLSSLGEFPAIVQGANDVPVKRISFIQILAGGGTGNNALGLDKELGAGLRARGCGILLDLSRP